LSIHKQAPELVAAATPITYVLTVKNQGQQTQKALLIRDKLPGNATYLSSSTGSNLVSEADGSKRIEWTVDSLAAGDTITVQLEISSTTTLINTQYDVLVNGVLAKTGSDPVLTLITDQLTTGNVDPQSGGVISTGDGTISVSFPSGSLSAPVSVVVASAEQPLTVAGFGGLAFSIKAIDGNGNEVTTFLEPLTIVVNYEDSDWQNAGIVDEAALKLFYWDGQTWILIPACAGCSHDTVANRITIVISHLSLFALREASTSIYLPMIVR